MDSIVLKNSLDKHSTIENLVINTILKVRTIPNVQLLKMNMELSSYICNIIENEVGVSNKTSKNIDKLDVFMRIVQEVFNNTITEADKKILVCQVEYLLDNNKIKILDPFAVWSKKVFTYLKSKIV